MRIAIVADPFFPVPPTMYGGTERVLYNLILGLQESNHSVTLFGSGDSSVPCNLIACCPTHYNSEIEGVSATMIENARQQNFSNILQRQSDFDVIHWHAGIDATLLTLKTPVLITPHIPYDRFELEDETVRQRICDLPHSSASNKYQQNFRGPRYIGTVYHGIDCELIPFQPNQGNYLSFVGRFSPEKQPHLALRFAIEMGHPIVVAGKIDLQYQDYYDSMCKPLLQHPLVTNYGEVSETKRDEIFRGASVNLHCIDVEETFGLTVVEAGLSGTPTIAFNRGSMPELIEHGRSGLLASDYAELSRLFHQAKLLDRAVVRKHFEQFSIRRMTDGYLRLYEMIV